MTIWLYDYNSYHMGNLSTAKTVSTVWQHRSKWVATSAFGAFACHVNFRFWSDYANFHWLRRHWFNTRVRTKQGRISTGWTSHKIPGYVPINSATDQHWLRDKWWSCLLLLEKLEEATGEIDACLQSPGSVWVLPSYTCYSAVVRLPLLHFEFVLICEWSRQMKNAQMNID